MFLFIEYLNAVEEPVGSYPLVDPFVPGVELVAHTGVEQAVRLGAELAVRPGAEPVVRPGVGRVAAPVA